MLRAVAHQLGPSLQMRADGEKLLAPDAPVFVGEVDGSPLRREDVNLVLELSAKELYGVNNSKLFRSHSLRHGGPPLMQPRSALARYPRSLGGGNLKHT
jgi:hypothetical protein